MGIRTRRIEILFPQYVNVAQVDFTRFEKNAMIFLDHDAREPIGRMTDIRYVPYKQKYTGCPNFPVQRSARSDEAISMHRKHMLICGVGGRWVGKTFEVLEVSLIPKPLMYYETPSNKQEEKTEGS